jgi:hypothetical protein
MADELNLDKDTVESVPITRFKEVSKKQLESEQRATELAEGLKKSEAEKETIIRERDFSNSFIDTIAQFPQAKDHKDEIKTKVLAGYSVEDATVAVLNKAGKLTVERKTFESPAGGSATTSISQSAPKSLANSSKEELRQAIIENDAGIMDFFRTGR